MTIFSRHPVDRPSISQVFNLANGREANNHQGVDYRPRVRGVAGDPIYAPADGFVVWARGGTFAANNPWEQLPNNGNNGNSVILQHVAPHQAVQSLYAHLDRIAVSEGQFVRAGDVIGYMGWTGYCIPASPDGTHLHWEVFIDYGNGQYPAGTFYGRVNPLDHFSTATVVPLGTGGKGSTTPIQEDDDMATPEEIWAYRTTVRGKPEQAIDVLVYANQFASAAQANAEQANHAAHRAEAKAEAAINAVAGLLSIQVPHPFEEGKTYALVDYIRYGNAFAGQAADASKAVMVNSDPEVLAEAVAQAAGKVNAQAFIDQVSVSLEVKEGAK